MKLSLKTAILFGALAMLVVPALSQNAPAASKKEPMSKMHAAKQAGSVKTVYACPKCHTASMKAGKDACGAEMKKTTARVAYVCDMDQRSSSMAGKCAKCGKEMQKAAIAYTCAKCDTSSAKPGDCKKCGKAMKKQMAKMM